jgi:hypothetical protein
MSVQRWLKRSPALTVPSIQGGPALSFHATYAKYIAETVSHESGHAFGLQHQSLYDASGVKIQEYYYGPGDGRAFFADGNTGSQTHNNRSMLLLHEAVMAAEAERGKSELVRRLCWPIL